jgi:hypothetical protein
MINTQLRPFMLIKVQETMTLSSFISGCGFPAISYLESLRTLRLGGNFLSASAEF